MAEKTGASGDRRFSIPRGARLDEGVDALNAYAMIAGRVSKLSGVVPQISLVLGQCGGVASAIAGMTDITVMSENGAMFVNGPMVVSALAGKQISMETLAGTQAATRAGIAQLDGEDRRRGHRACAQSWSVCCR